MAPLIMMQQRSLLARSARPMPVSTASPVRAVRLMARAHVPAHGDNLQNDLGTDEARKTAKTPIDVVLGALKGESAQEADQMIQEGATEDMVKQKVVQQKLQEDRKKIYSPEGQAAAEPTSPNPRQTDQQ